jgi:hypothetical protein
LSTEFTDLEGLIKKMISEKLTGYIDVTIDQGKEAGLIFIINGTIMGGSYSWSNGKPTPNKENQELLIKKTKQKGGVFNVCRIPISKMNVERPKESSDHDDFETIRKMLEELLVTFESVVSTTKKNRADFNKILKQKFVEKADRYAFLDPFVGELEYSNQQLSFVGYTSNENFANGIIESVKEMAHEIGVLPRLVGELGPWSEKYAEELNTYEIDF